MVGAATGRFALGQEPTETPLAAVPRAAFAIDSLEPLSIGAIARLAEFCLNAER